MAVMEKALQIAHRSEISPGKLVHFAATPYEGQTVFIGGHSPDNPHGYSWDSIPGTGYGFLGSPPAGLAFGYSKDYSDPRPDIRLVSAKGGGMGWTFTHEGRSKSTSYNQFYGNRSLRTVIYEVRDGGDATWRCRSSGHVASSIILPQGITSRRGLNGENIITIQSATPDAFLASLSLPQLPYILAKPANDERFAWWFLSQNGYLPFPATPPNPLPDNATRVTATQTQLGYRLSGDDANGIKNGFYVDPFSGFANYRDQDTLTVGELMQPAPANDLHFCNKLSSSRVLVEILTNHVLANGKGIGLTFPMEIQTGQDFEQDILHFEVSGGINSIINEAAQHGVWRAWWDSRCGFHFIPDYYAGPLPDGSGIPQPGKVAITIQDGPSLVGELEVNPGSADPIVHSQRVRGQPFTSFGDATTDPMTNYYNMKLGAIFPVGAKDGDGPGSDPTMDNYMGKNALVQAGRLYYKENARTTFSWKNFPYPALAMGLLHRVIILKARDPKGAWDYSSGKRFVVENVSVGWQDNGKGGGVYLCSISGIEVIYSG
jgi:hypothetical protein